MDFTIADLDLRSHDELEFVQWLDSQRFIDITNKKCPACNSTMVLGESTHFKGDGVCLRCTNAECNHRRSVRTGSFFSRSHFSLVTQMKLITLFAADSTVTSAAKSLGVSRRALTDYFDNCRGEYADALDPAMGYSPIVFNPDSEYELDECQIKRVTSPDGVVCVNVAGIFERGTGKVLMYRVPDRSAESLLPPIWDHIPKGSRVYSDSWPVYVHADWAAHGMSHWHVNHSAGEYARTETVILDGAHEEVINVHCNSLEGLWSHLKTRLACKSRRTIERMDLVLSEMMWRHCGLSLFLPFKC
jgi:hypothetical protein